MTTLAIPAEIVGDTETLHRRRDDMREHLASCAVVAGRWHNAGLPTAHFVEDCGELVVHYDAIRSECDRRRAAKTMAHAIQPEETRWR